jgi:hypothetical protein
MGAGVSDKILPVPPSWFVEPILRLALSSYENALVKRGIVSITIRGLLAERVGLAPGEKMLLATPDGDIEILATKDE